MIDSLKSRYPDLVLIDGGNFGETPAGPSVWKTYEQLRLLHKMSYDAVALGQNDLCPALADSAANWRCRDLLFSSFHAIKAKAEYPAVKVIKKSDYKIGVVNVISASLNRLEDNSPAYDAEKFLSEQLSALKNQSADFLAVVYLGPPHELVALSTKFPEVDLWLQAHGNHRPQNLIDSAKDAPIVSAGDRGREIAFITIEKEKAGTRTATSFNQIILTDRIADSPKAKPWIESFRQAGQHGVAPPQKVGEVKGLNPYLGSATCQSCHQEIFLRWENTAHAHAFATLAAKSEDKNAACLECHTTGYREETGYAASIATAHLVQVGCESCHGRGGFHVRMNGRISNFVRISETICLRCHDDKNSPNFAYAEVVESVH
ncbi:MAG: multiheme c-type cytochrome [bacterium]